MNRWGSASLALALLTPSFVTAQETSTPIPTAAIAFAPSATVDSVSATGAAAAPLSDQRTRDAIRTPGGLASLLSADGRYVYRITREESDDVRAAIERSIAHMSFIIRPIARHRLARTNRVPAYVAFTVRNDTLVVAFEKANPIVTPLDGNFVPWVSGVSEEIYRVRVTSAADTLHQLISASDGWRADDFIFSDGGRRVELHVTLKADLLPKPVVYGLVFERDDQPEAAP
jgi:hypothetical protein